MVKITGEKIRNLFEKYDEHVEDMEDCGHQVRKFLDELVIRGSLTDIQKNEIRGALVTLDQRLREVNKSRIKHRGDERSERKREQMAEDEERLAIQLSLTKSMLYKYLEKEEAPEVSEGVRRIEVSEEEIQIYLDAIKKDDDDSSYNGLGDAYYRKGDYENAIKYYQEAIKRNSNVSTYYSNLADASGGLGKWDDALRNYKIAIQMNDRDDWALNGVGNAMMAKSKYDEAIESYQKAIQLNPHHTYYDNIADAYRFLGNWDYAVLFYEQALELHKNDYRAHNGLGLCCLNSRNYEDAIKHFTQAVSLNPKDFLYHSNLGVAYTELGEHDEAIKEYEKALDLNPDDYTTLTYLGDTKLRKEQFEDAVKCFEKAIPLSRGPDPHIYSLLGDAYRGLGGKSDEALENYEKGLNINPEHDRCLNGKGLVFLSEGRNQEAADMFSQAIAVNSNNFAFHSNLGIALGGMGKIADATESFKKALQINPEDSISYEALGLLYHRLGLFAKAIEQFKAAINIEKSPRYYSEMGISYLSQKKWKEAFEYLEKARELDPNDNRILSNLAIGYNARGLELYKNKEDDNAIEYYKLASDLEPGNDVYHSNLFLAYIAKKDYVKAEHHLTNAMRLNPNRQEYKHFLTRLKHERSKA